MAWVPLAAMAASSVLGAKGAQDSAAAQQSADYFQAGQDEQQASAIQSQGYEQAKRIKTQGDSTQSAARASLASSGVDVNSGSAIADQKKIDQNATQDAMQTILSDDNQATSLRQQAVMTRAGGDSAAAAGQTNALTSLLRGASMSSKGGWKTAATSGG